MANQRASIVLTDEEIDEFLLGRPLGHDRHHRPDRPPPIWSRCGSA